MAFGRNPFLDFLEQAGFTAPAPAVPKYQSRPDLRIRGNPENTAQQTRQYAAPYVAPPVQQQPTPMVARGGSFTPDQVMDQFLMSPAAQFLDPAQLDSARARLTQEILRDPAAQTQLDQADTLSPSEVVSATGIPDAVVDTAESHPIASIEKWLRDDYPDAAEGAFGKVMDYYNYPIDKRKDITGDFIIAEAQGQDAGIDWRGFLAINPTMYGLPLGYGVNMSGQFSPEQKAEILQVAKLAETNGQDPGRAVWEWYIGQFPLFTRGMTELLGDPANWTIGATPAGDAVIGASGGSKVLRTVGELLKLPQYIADAPVELPLGAARIIRRGMGLRPFEGEAVPIIREIAKSSDAQVARDVEAVTGEATNTASDLLGRYGDQSDVRVAEAQAVRDEAARRQAEQNLQAQGVVPEQAVMPNGQVDIQMQSRRAAANTPEPAALVNTVRPEVVPPNGIETQPVNPDLQLEPFASDQPSAVSAIEQADAVDAITPEIEPQPVSPEIGPTMAEDIQEPFTPPEGDYSTISKPNAGYEDLGAPDVVPPPSDGIYRTGTGNEFPSGWSNTVREQDDNAAYGRTYLKTRGAAEYPEQSKWVDDSLQEWDEGFYEPMHNASTSNALSWENPNGGMHKTLAPMLDGEYYGRRRVLMHAAGMDVEMFPWRRNPLLTGEVDDAAFRAGRGNKAQTLQSKVDEFIFEETPDAKRMQDLFDTGAFRKSPGASKFEQEGYWRYQKSKAIRDLVHATPEQMDEILRRSGTTPSIAKPAATDMSRVPSADLLRARGDEWAAQAHESIASLPPQAQVAIYRELADFADELNINDLAADDITAMLRDLDYAAEVRRLVTKAGGTVPPPSSPLTINGLSQSENLRKVILGADEKATAQYRRFLYDEGVIRKSPPSVDRDVNPALFESQDVPYQNYQYVYDLRKKIHGPVDVESPPAMAKVRAQVAEDDYLNAAKPVEVSTPNGKVTTKKPNAPRLKAVSAEQYERRLKSEINKVVKDWDQDPAMGMRSKADYVLGYAEANGDLTKEQIAFLRNEVTVNGGTKKYPVTRKISPMDLLIEQDLLPENVTAADARRATNSILANALRKDPEGSKKVRAAIRAYDFGTNLTREMQMYGVNVVRGAIGDAVATSYTVYLTGHRGAAFKAWLTPSAYLSLIKHNYTGSEVVSPVLDLAGKWGVKPGHNVIDVVAREMQAGPGELAWSKLVGTKLATPLKAGQAVRHAGDQQIRLTVWGDEFSRQLHAALNGQKGSVVRGRTEIPSFYNHVVEVMGGGDVAEDAVRQLQRKGNFLPSDVRDITGSTRLMQDWRETVSSVAKKADDEVDKVLFSYRQTRADAKTRRIFMYHYWQTRAIVQHTKLTITNPLLMHRYQVLWQTLDREAERQGEDGPLAPMKVMFEFMKGDGGLYGVSNPLAYLLPWTMFMDAFDGAFPGEGKVEKAFRRSGFYVVPQLQAALVSFGIMGRYPDLLGTSSARNIVRQVLDWDRNNHNILHLGPGITGDPVQYYYNRAIERANAALREFLPEIEDIELPNLNAPKQIVIANLIVEQAEKDFGVPYLDMTPGQREVVVNAIRAAQNGETDNPRANAALKEASPLWQTVLDRITPGGFRARSEYADENAQTKKEAAASSEPNTQEENNAFAVSDITHSGSDEALNLNVGQDNLQSLGTEQQRALYKGWNVIVYDDLDPNAYEDIGGNRYYGREINAMSHDERTKLADAWALSYMDAPVDTNPNDGIEPKNELDQYRDERDAYIASNPDVQGYDEYKDRANNYGTEQTGGRYQIDKDGNSTIVYEGTPQVRQFREYVAGQSPEFAQSLDQERQRLQAKGVSGEELERQLDRWTTSADGYNAARGVANRMGDATPLSSGEIPLSNSETEQMITDAVAEGVKQGSSGGSSSGFNTEYNRPQFQVDLLKDYQAFVKVKDSFEQQYGPLDNFQSRQGQAAVARFFADQGVEVSKDLSKYLQWAIDQRAAGADDSIEAYFAMQDRAYEEKKAKESTP